MSNYTTENLVPVLNPAENTRAIRVGDIVLIVPSGGSGGGMDDLEFFDWFTILSNQ